MAMEAGTDFVDPGMFLRGCKEPLEQYQDCLMKNLKDWNGRGLHRGKLSEVKIHQLGQMNITRFDHQKLIMDRIRRLPEIPSMPRYTAGAADTAELEAAVHVAPRPRGKSDGRKLSNSMSASSSVGDSSADDSASADGVKGTKSRHKRGSMRHGIGVKGGRRGSMAIDKNWESINKSRAQADGGMKQKQLNNIRRRKSNVGAQPPEPRPFNPADFASDQNEDPTSGSSLEGTTSDANNSKGAGAAAAATAGASRRKSALSLNNPDKARQAQIEAAKAKRQRAMEYGNSVLKATTREGDLKELKKQILADFVNTIGCDRATLMFVDTPAQELFFFDGSSRISFPLRKGIAGHCAESGMGVIVNDPYNNEHFNRQIDKDSGFMTRNILCEPIKSRKGGNVVAVLQMVNKKDAQDFTEQDAGVMEMCVVKVALALDSSFSALIQAENEWAKTAGRRRSSTIGSTDEGSSLSTAAEAAAAAATATAEVAAQQEIDEKDKGGGALRRASSLGGRRGSALFDDGGPSSHEISNRRGSGASKADVEKLKRRTDYGKEVRDSSVGLL